MPKRKELSETMEHSIADRWAASYESAAERASKAEMRIRHLEERIWQLEKDVADWKAFAMRCHTKYGNSFSSPEAGNAGEHDAATAV